MDHIIKNIIIHFLQHRISREEMAVLDRWMQQSGNKAIFKDFAAEWLTGETSVVDFSAGQAFRRFIAMQKWKQRRQLYMRCFKYAAVVLILIGGTLGWWLVNRPVVEPGMIETASVLKPLGRNAILTLEDGEKMVLSEGDSLYEIVSEADNCLRLSGNQMVYQTGGTDNKPVFHTLQIPAGAEFQLTLSDGTKVWLNNLSQLKYPVKFSKQERVVYLEGEAYFEVAHNEKSPFRIVTDRSVLNVLGTNFNVNAYRGEARQEITLVTGKLRVEAAEQKVTLSPGKQAVLDENNHIEVAEVDTFIYTAWREGKFYFNNETLEKVIQRLSQWYRFEYQFTDEKLKQEQIMCIVNKYDDFDTIIQLIQKTQCADLVYEHGKIIVKPFGYK